MSALWGHRGEPPTETWWAYCADCQWEAEAIEIHGSDAVMTVAALTRAHNVDVHEWDELRVPA